MAFKHTGKYWRFRCSNALIRARPNRNRRKNKRSKVTGKDSELKSLLVTIFSKAKLEIEPSFSVLPELTYILFEYFSDLKKLDFSLSLKGNLVRIGEIFDLQKIIDTLKDLSVELIPKWCLDILSHYRGSHDSWKSWESEFYVKCGLTLANINLIDGEKTQRMFDVLFLTRVKSDAKNPSPFKEYIINLLKKRQSADSVYSFLQSCSIFQENPLTTVCPDLQSLRIVDSSFFKETSNNQLNKPIDDLFNKPSEDPLNKPSEGPLKKPTDDLLNPLKQIQVVERCTLLGKLKIEIFFKKFLKNRPVTSEVFTFCCVDIQGVLVNTRFYSYIENKRYKGHLVENVSDLSGTPANFTNAIRFETASRATLNKYICQLFDNILSTLKEVTVLYQPSEDMEIHKLIDLKVLEGESSETNLVNSQDLSQNKETGAKKETNELIGKIGDVTLHWVDLKTLLPYHWLNDKIVGAYLNLICERSKRFTDILPKVFALSSFFFFSLHRGLVKLKKYTKHKIHLYDYLFFPYNLYTYHWTLFVVDVKSRTILFFDSLPNESMPSDVKLLCKFLVDLEALYMSQNFPGQKRRVLPYTYKLGECVKQTNGTDCGVFVITLAEYISRREPLNYTEDQMACIRMQVAYEIVGQKLSAPLKIIPPNGYPELLSDVDLGDMGGEYKTLSCSITVCEKVITNYWNLLKEKYCMYVHPGPTDFTKEIFVFPFTEKKKKVRRSSVIIINKKSNVMYHYFMPSTPSPEDEELCLTLQSNTGLNLSNLTMEKLPYPEDKVDSAVYVLSAAAAIAGGHAFDFEERNISYLRKKIYLELHGKV